MPPLAIRIGVSGSRAIPADRVPALREDVADLLLSLRRILDHMIEVEGLNDVYLVGDDLRPAMLRVVSPLAEGADRLVAEVAFDLGHPCHAPLPFARQDYENDAPNTVAQFRRLADQASVIELDGVAADRTTAYSAVGQYVVRNCDLLIAIWDGLAERGPGGTAEVVRFAAEVGVPVWWIDVSGGDPPRMILDFGHYKDPRTAPRAAAAEAALHSVLRALLVPPVPGRLVRDGILGGVTAWLYRAFGDQTSPLRSYFAEPIPAARGFSRIHDAFLTFIVGSRHLERPEARMRDDASALSWHLHFKRADRLSVAYGNRYRSSYVLIAALAFAGVLASVINAFTYRESHLFVAAELLLLVGIGVIVMANHWFGWQERWITYRLLAELCRKQGILASLGRSLPSADIRQIALDTPDRSQEDAARGAWASWYFEALRRATPFPARDLSEAKRDAFEAGRHLIVDQTRYHSVRRDNAERSDRRLGEMSEFFFLAIMASVAGRLLLTPESGFAEGMEGLATIFSAATAAFVGLRAYSEFALVAHQSSRMIQMLREADRELELIALEQPLSSEALGETLLRLSMSMLREVQGWVELFRVKAIETG